MNSEHAPIERQRPRWACCIHNFGDDLHWAISAWCNFPRPARRFAGGVVTTVAAHAFGAGELANSVVTNLLG